jgi:hypothetical protein
MTQQIFDINKFSDVEEALRQLQKELGRLAEEDLRLYERINARTGATGMDTAFGEEAPSYGTIIADHGVIGGGTLPPEVTIAQRGAIWSGMFVTGEAHGNSGTLYIREGSVLHEEVVSV